MNRGWVVSDQPHVATETTSGFSRAPAGYLALQTVTEYVGPVKGSRKQIQQAVHRGFEFFVGHVLTALNLRADFLNTVVSNFRR